MDVFDKELFLQVLKSLSIERDKLKAQVELLKSPLRELVNTERASGGHLSICGQLTYGVKAHVFRDAKNALEKTPEQCLAEAKMQVERLQLNIAGLQGLDSDNSIGSPLGVVARNAFIAGYELCESASYQNLGRYKVIKFRHHNLQGFAERYANDIVQKTEGVVL